MSGPCPSPETLERRAGGAPEEESLTRHLQDCPACRERLERLRRDNELAEQVALDLRQPAMPPVHGPAPESVPGFVLVRELGRGAQGTVFEARQLATNRRVALKVMRPFLSAQTRVLRRLEREAELAGELRHPNIVTIYSGERLADGRYALAMEYIDGVALDRWLEGLRRDNDADRSGRARAQEQALAVFEKLCDALTHAHRHGVMHRDLKPSNILIDAGGEPRILDFGIARRIVDDPTHAITGTGNVACTLAYASPEQLAGDVAQVDSRTDVYSLGVILYEMLTGRPPYELDGSLQDVVRRITSVEPVAPSRVTRTDAPVDADLDTITLRALVKDKERRYQSVDELKADLQARRAGRPIAAKMDSVLYVLRKAAVRHRVPIVLAFTAVLALAVYAATTSILLAASRRAEQAAQLAQRRTAAALSASNIERGRLQAKIGSLDAAEAILWSELLATQADLTSDQLLVRGPSDVLRAAWALVELASNAPRRQKGLTRECGLPIDWNETGIAWLGAEGQKRVFDPAALPVERDRQAAGVWQPFMSGENPEVRLAESAGAIRLVRRADGQVLGERAIPAGTRSRYTLLAQRGMLVAWWCDGDGVLRVLDDALNELAAWPAPLHTLTVGFSSDGERLAVLDADGTLALWNWRAGQIEGRLPLEFAAGLREGVRGPVGQVAWSPDGRRLAILFVNWLGLGAIEGKVTTLWRATSAMSGVRFSADGSMVLAAARDGIVRVWDTDARTVIARHAQLPGDVGGGVFSPDGRSLAATDSSGALEVWDLLPRQWLRRVRAPEIDTPHMLDAKLSPDGTMIAGVCWSGVALWSWPALEPLGLLNLTEPASSDSRAPSGTRRPTANALHWLPDGRRLVLSTYGGEVQVWDVAARRREQVLTREALPIADLAIDPAGARVAWVARNGPLTVWDLERSQLIARVDAPVRYQRTSQLRWSPDGSLIAQTCIDGKDGTVALLWNASDWSVRAVLGGHAARARAVAFSADSALAATGSDDSTIRIWNTRGRGETVRVISGVPADVFGLAFHPDGALLFASLRDRMLCVYDLRTGEELAQLDGHESSVFTLQFADAGRTLISASDDGTLGVWDLQYYLTHLRGNVAYQQACRPATPSASASLP